MFDAPATGGRRRAGRAGLETDGYRQCVEVPLLDTATVGVLASALGAPDAVSDAVDQRPELRAQYPIERGVRHQHAVLAVAEVQPAPAALAQMLFVKVGGILVELGPFLDVPPRTVGRYGGDLSEQLGVPVNGLGTGRPGGAS